MATFVSRDMGLFQDLLIPYSNNIIIVQLKFSYHNFIAFKDHMSYDPKVILG